ncbi:MAG: hypothetical protein ACT4PY_12460 [Armatimonadota bacterium]
MSIAPPALSTSVLVVPGWAITVSAPQPVTDALERLLAELDFSDEPLPPLRLIVSEDLQWMAGEAAGNPPWRLALPPSQRLGVILGQCVAAATALLHRRVFVHAGAVALGGRGVMIVGGSGTGKTAMVARLLQRGGWYLSDEVALLDPSAGTVAPFSIPMAIKPWTSRAIGKLLDGRTVATDGELRFHLPDRVQRTPVQLVDVVLLRPPRPRAQLLPVTRGQTLMALGTHATSLIHRDRLETAFEGFGSLLRGARCSAVEGPSPAACVDLLFEKLWWGLDDQLGD